MIASKIIAVLAISHQALALPSFYDERKQGCEIPSQAFGGHGAPTVNEEMAFELTTAAGEAVTAYEAGMEYTLTVTPPTAANLWAHSSIGEIAPMDTTTHTQASACPQASFSATPAATHSFTWTAGADDSECVTVSAAAASSPASAYMTNTVTIPGAGVTGDCPEPPAAEDTAEGTDAAVGGVSAAAAAAATAVATAVIAAMV